jgi:predicted nucleic acid-binding protein
MLKKLVNTNIFINRFSNPDLYKDIFLSDGLIYLSSVVLMELRAGAHTKKAINVLFDHFKRVDRIALPSISDYERAGEIIAKLQVAKGYNIKKSSSITNDTLIAASAKSIGAVVFTQNKKDFQTIQEIFNFKAVFV